MTQSPQRLERALAAFARQEFGAPFATIVGLAEILGEDERQAGRDDVAADLDRIRAAGLQLQELVNRLVARALPAAPDTGEGAAFEAKLLHDLRTPLNAVKGYSELIIEEARDAGRHALAADVAKLSGAADQLLARIDTLMAQPDGAAQATVAAPDAAAPRDLVGRVLASIRPVDAAPAQVSSGGPASRILVVDDTEANRELLSRRLRREGHAVTMVESGRAALERVAAGGFDLILLDLMMPGMNGFEVLCRLKADPGQRHIPVIMISALDELDSIVRCIEAGAEDYLPKPFNPILLRARIEACLDKKRLRDREQAVTARLAAEKSKSDALLRNILPETVIARIRQGESVIADRFPDATILFSDLVGFTSLAGRLPPARVIEILNRLFSAFDGLATGLKLEKIKTIGDAYMVAGGLPEPHPDHAVAVADMALGMIDVVGRLGAALGEPLGLRIGIHSGDVVAGIIGQHRFTYDVWGDTVNTASRLQSSGIANRVQLSEATYARIRHAFRCEARGPVRIKGKGVMQTWFLGSRYG